MPTLPDLLSKKPDLMGRLKFQSTDVIPAADVLDVVSTFEHQLQENQATRWAVRALVDSSLRADDVARLLPPRRFLEFTEWQVNKSSRFVWFASNSHDRMPSPEVRDAYLNTLHELRARQISIEPTQDQCAAELLDWARSSRVRVITLDGLNNFQRRQEAKSAVARMLREKFYFDPQTATNMSEGHGYGLTAHRLYLLVDEVDQVICMLMTVPWPWGVEATYAIVNDRYQRSRESSRNPMRLLLTIANLNEDSVLPDGTNFYAEVNIYSSRAFQDAFFSINPGVELHPSAWRYDNIVWADNPINMTKSEQSVPNFDSAIYHNYVVVSSDRSKLRAADLKWRDLLHT